MRNPSRFFLIGMTLTGTASLMQATASDRVTVTSSPETARIYVDGVQMGTGKVVVKVAKCACVTDPPSSDYVQLQEDESYTSSIESNIANTEIQVNVHPAKSKEEAWKEIVAVVLEKFDVLENSDEKSGYAYFLGGDVL
jgi:hypothetical protein